MKYDEHALQVQIHSWLEKTFECEVVAVPNGGFRGTMEAIRLRKEGVQAGHPDLIVYAAGGIIRHIEVKTAKGPLTESQKDFLPRLGRLGFPTAIVRSLDEAKAEADGWGLPPRVPRERSAAEVATGF